MINYFYKNKFKLLCILFYIVINAYFCTKLSKFIYKEYNSLFLSAITIVAFVLLILIIFFFIFKVTRLAISKQTIFLILYIILGFLFALTLKPLDAPDEITHFINIYEQSNKILNTSTFVDNNLVQMRCSDAQFLNLTSNIIADKYVGVSTSIIIDRPIPYLFHTLGLVICRLLNFSSIFTFYFVRIFAFILYSLVLYFVLKITNCNTNFVYLIVLLPLFIQQQSTYTYDSFTNTVTICFFVLIYTYFLSKNIKFIYLSFLFAILIIFAKSGAYIPLLFLYFPLLSVNKVINKITSNKFAYLFISILILLVFIAFPIFFKDQPSFLLKNNVKYNSLGFIISNPLRYLIILLYTCVRQFLTLSTQLVGNMLGALSIQNSYLLTIPIAILFIYCLFEKKDDKLIVNNYMMFSALFSIFVSLFGIFTFIYIVESYNYGEWYVHGVQGRYCIPILLPCYLFFKRFDKLSFYNEQISKNIIFVISSLDVFIALFIRLFYLNIV